MLLVFMVLEWTALVTVSCIRAEWLKGRTFPFMQGVCDLLVAAMMIAATVLQRTYVPSTNAGCYPYSGPQAVQDLFAAVANNNSDDDGPGDACQNFQTEWIVAIVLMSVHPPLRWPLFPDIQHLEPAR